MLATDRVDGRRLKGERSRRAIVDHAARVASAEGLEAVSLQRLAADLRISKSGLFAHFGSKEDLQIATIEAAARIVVDEVVRPAIAAPRGLPRLWWLCEGFISYLEREVFPGGCPIAGLAAEYDSRRGRVREAVAGQRSAWVKSLSKAVRQSQDEGHLDRGVDPDRLAWELDCILLGANSSFQMERDRAVFEWARASLRARLRAALTEAAPAL